MALSNRPAESADIETSTGMRFITENLSILPRTQSFTARLLHTGFNSRKNQEFTVALNPALGPAERNAQSRASYENQIRAMEDGSWQVEYVDTGSIKLDTVAIANLPGATLFLEAVRTTLRDLEISRDIPKSEKLSAVVKAVQRFNTKYTGAQSIDYKVATAELQNMVKAEVLAKQVQSAIDEIQNRRLRDPEYQAVFHAALRIFQAKHPNMLGITPDAARKEMEEAIESELLRRRTRDAVDAVA